MKTADKLGLGTLAHRRNLALFQQLFGRSDPSVLALWQAGYRQDRDTKEWLPRDEVIARRAARARP